MKSIVCCLSVLVIDKVMLPPRFLLCNHGTLTPAQQIPVRQHSSISQSSASGHPDEGEDPLITDGAAAVTDGGEDKGVKRHELMKTISTDDEVARLTIEVISNFVRTDSVDFIQSLV